MITLEQVEKLREYADITYDEAKAALESADGDILQALIDLERQGKVKAPQGGGRYNSGSIGLSSTPGQEEAKKEKASVKIQHRRKIGIQPQHGNFFRWMGEIIHKGNVNAMVVDRMEIHYETADYRFGSLGRIRILDH